MNQREIDDDIAARAAVERNEAMAEGWRLMAQAREAIDACSDLARALTIWRGEHPDVAWEIPVQEVEKLAREGIV